VEGPIAHRAEEGFDVVGRDDSEEEGSPT